MSRRDGDLRSKASESRASSWRVTILSGAFVLMALSLAVIAACLVWTLVVVVPELLDLGWVLKDEVRHLAETLAEVDP